MMTRRLSAVLAAGLIALGGAGLPSPARALTDEQKALVDRIQTYVNGISTVKTRFVQTSPDGRRVTGTIYISRPGKLRIDFDPPSQMRIVTTRLWLVVYEDRRTEPQNYPLNSTPAGILVQEKIDFGGALKVTNVRQTGQTVLLTLIRTKNPGQGSMTLIFAPDPLKLVGWIVTDSQGQRTRVRLTDTQIGVKLDPNIFSLRESVRAPGVER